MKYWGSQQPDIEDLCVVPTCGTNLFSTGKMVNKGPSWSRMANGQRNQSLSTVSVSFPAVGVH
jgi:hypothetical protein